MGDKTLYQVLYANWDDKRISGRWLYNANNCEEETKRQNTTVQRALPITFSQMGIDLTLNIDRLVTEE